MSLGETPLAKAQEKVCQWFNASVGKQVCRGTHVSTYQQNGEEIQYILHFAMFDKEVHINPTKH